MSGGVGDGERRSGPSWPSDASVDHLWVSHPAGSSHPGPPLPADPGPVTVNRPGGVGIRSPGPLPGAAVGRGAAAVDTIVVLDEDSDTCVLDGDSPSVVEFISSSPGKRTRMGLGVGVGVGGPDVGEQCHGAAPAPCAPAGDNGLAAPRGPSVPAGTPVAVQDALVALHRAPQVPPSSAMGEGGGGGNGCVGGGGSGGGAVRAPSGSAPPGQPGGAGPTAGAAAGLRLAAGPGSGMLFSGRAATSRAPFSLSLGRRGGTAAAAAVTTPDPPGPSASRGVELPAHAQAHAQPQGSLGAVQEGGGGGWGMGGSESKPPTTPVYTGSGMPGGPAAHVGSAQDPGVGRGPGGVCTVTAGVHGDVQGAGDVVTLPGRGVGGLTSSSMERPWARGAQPPALAAHLARGGQRPCGPEPCSIPGEPGVAAESPAAADGLVTVSRFFPPP